VAELEFWLNIVTARIIHETADVAAGMARSERLDRVASFDSTFLPQRDLALRLMALRDGVVSPFSYESFRPRHIHLRIGTSDIDGDITIASALAEEDLARLSAQARHVAGELRALSAIA
jgi:hypothetical protein